VQPVRAQPAQTFDPARGIDGTKGAHMHVVSAGTDDARAKSESRAHVAARWAAMM